MIEIQHLINREMYAVQKASNQTEGQAELPDTIQQQKSQKCFKFSFTFHFYYRAI